MVNAEIQTLHEPDGTPVTNVTFDLSTLQLGAVRARYSAVRRPTKPVAP